MQTTDIYTRQKKKLDLKGAWYVAWYVHGIDLSVCLLSNRMLNKETCKLQTLQHHSEHVFKTITLFQEENINENLGQNTFHKKKINTVCLDIKTLVYKRI